MNQAMKSTLADCYSQISDIWLSTARIARTKLDYALIATEDSDYWEALERRCCIRAGYYARLAEQHRALPSHFKDDEDEDGWKIGTTRDLVKFGNDIDAALKQTLNVEEGGTVVVSKQAAAVALDFDRRGKPKGSSAGGLARAEKLSPKRRREIARAAATARWKRPPNAS